MSSAPRRPSPVAGIIGSVGGIAAAGFVHSMLPAGNIWLRAAETSASAAVAAGLLAMAAARLLITNVDVRVAGFGRKSRY